MRKNRSLVLADDSQRYQDAILDAFDYARGRKKINLDINKPKLELPTVKLEPTPQTMKTIKQTGYLLAGAIGLLALSQFKSK